MKWSVEVTVEYAIDIEADTAQEAEEKAKAIANKHDTYGGDIFVEATSSED